LILGISFILSAINVFFRDIENVLGVFLTIWMYMTPILYSPSLIPQDLKNLFYLNPMTGIINAYREAVLFGNFPQIFDLLYPGIFSIAVFIIGVGFFRKRAKFFADVI
jgi:ABC-2 type transport system permease protein